MKTFDNLHENIVYVDGLVRMHNNAPTPAEFDAAMHEHAALWEEDPEAGERDAEQEMCNVLRELGYHKGVEWWEQRYERAENPDAYNDSEQWKERP